MKLFRNLAVATALAGWIVSAASAEVNPNAGAPAFGERERQEIYALIEHYLANNPEVIMGAMEKMAQHQERATKIYDNAPFVGAENGNIVVIEYVDYSCDPCLEAGKALRELASERDDLRLITLDLPLLERDSVILSRLLLSHFFENNNYEEVREVVVRMKPQATVSDIVQEVGKTFKTPSAESLNKAKETLKFNRDVVLPLGIDHVPLFLVQNGDDIQFTTDVNEVIGLVGSFTSEHVR